MPAKALKFISARSKATAQIEKRVAAILWYTIECYQILLKTKPVYSKAKIRSSSTLHFEDYLKAKFVNDFLVVNKHLLRAKMSGLEEVNFEFETQKLYIDSRDGKEKPDKIDVYVNKLGLKKLLSMPDEQIYFVIECKRIETVSDTDKYISDTEKFTIRNYGKSRLPFEGQIAFIENSKLTHSIVQIEINDRLKKSSSIITKRDLKPITLHKSFTGSYSSKHKKNFAPNRIFTIHHLLFDYSSMVIS